MYKAPRGTSDILPQEQAYWRYIEQKIAELCRLYGYQRIDTPVFEDARLFVRTIGEGTDIVEKEMYSFEDRGGDFLTLRPEGTAPVCRAYLEHGMHNLPQPVKLYYLAPIFRYERPQAGRYRQHWQFGFEALGSPDPAIDAEVIDLACSFYQSLGLKDLRLKLNSIGCPNCRAKYLESLRDFYSERRELLCPDCKRRLERNPLRLLDCKEESCLELGKQAPKIGDYLCQECRAHFDSLKRYLLLLKITFEEDHRLVRGLDYYTKTVFEIHPRGEEGAQTALGGGGRYDNLIEELGGKPTPAVGFAAGIERAILNLKKQGISVPSPPQTSVFVAYLNQEAKDKAIEYVAQLRREGIGAVFASGDRSLKAQLRQANALGANYTIIIGEDELKDGLIVWRDMVKSEQQRLTFAEALEILKKVN